MGTLKAIFEYCSSFNCSQKRAIAHFEIIPEEEMEMEVVHLVVDDDWWQYRVTHTHTHTQTPLCTQTHTLTPLCTHTQPLYTHTHIQHIKINYKKVYKSLK